jgi:hypothetical protein
VTHLRHFIAWLEQYYPTGFETALKEAREFAGNSKYNIPLEFKEKNPFAEKGCLITRILVNLQETQKIVSE